MPWAEDTGPVAVPGSLVLPAPDYAAGMFADASGIYVVGDTRGALPGQTSSGTLDAFVRKYDTAGTELWTHQLGTKDSDRATGVAAEASGVYVVGWTDVREDN